MENINKVSSKNFVTYSKESIELVGGEKKM